MGLINKIFSPLGDALSWLLDLDEQFEDANSGALVNKQSNIDPLPIIYGTRKLGGTRVFVSTGGGNNNEYLYIVLALCEGEIQSIGDVYINDKLSTHTDYNNLVTIEKYTGTDDQTATTLFNDANDSWTSAHRLRGVAYLAVRLKYNKDVFGSIPEIQCIVDGKKVYDPRQDSTSAHYDSDVGVATQRETNSTTWKSNTNPAICLMDYLKNSRYGKSLSTSFVNVADFVTAANDCDDSVVEYSGSANAPLFQMNAIVATDKSIFDNTKIMLSAMRGYLNYINGQYTLRIDKPQAYSFSLDHTNITSDISVSSNDKNSKFNKVTAKFVNPDANWQSDTVIWPPADSIEETTFLAEDNNQELATEITVDHITSPYIARELAKTYCLSSRKQTLQVELTALSDAYECIVGDVVRLTHESMGWTNKLFQINRMTLDDSGEVSLTLREYDQDVYTWYEGPEQENNAQSTLPDPFAILPPTNLSAVAGSQLADDGTTLSYIDLSWTAANDAFVSQYEISYSATGISDQTILVNNTTHRIFVLNTSVDYSFGVRSINDLGVKSTAVAATDISAVIDTVAPGVPTNLSVDGTFKQIELSWDNPTDNDFKYVEIKRAGTTIEGDAVVIATTAGDSYIDGNYTGVNTRYYWLRAIDYTGNASAWVSAGGGTTQHLVTDDFDDGVITIDHLNTDTQLIINSVADYDTDISNINTSITNINTDITNLDTDVNTRALDSDFQNVTQRLDDTLYLAGQRLLSMSLFASEQTQIMRDAGVTVDPDNGSVTIQAVEALRSDVDSSFNQVNIELDAQEATINLKASTTYVNNAIASAVLDSADLASLNDLEAKVAQAEIDIDGNTASILLKADQTEIDSLDIRVAQAEIDIDGAEASIALKANQTDFTSLQTRVGDAEIVINALDVPSITQTVSDVSNLNHRVNAAEVQDIKQLLEIYDTRQVLQQDIAFARTQITADTLETREAIATQKTELLARIDDNQASIISETTARANADTAITEDITQLQADLSTSDGNIAGNATAITALDGRVTINEGEITSQASEITSLQSSVTDLETDTTGNATAITNLDTRVTSNETSISSQATSITQIESDITDLGTDTSTNATAISGLDTRVTQTETDITSQATAITSLESDVGDLQTSTGANATAVTNLDTRVTANETSITSQSTSITNLGSSITDLETDTSNNATAISQLSTTVTQNGVDITAVSQDLTNLTATVGDNTADIIEVSEVASSETRASAKRLEQLVTGQAETQLTEILNREDNQTFLNAEIAVVRSDFNAVTTENRESIAQTRTDLVALIDNNASSITSEQLARVSADQSLASDITSLRSDLTFAEGDIVANANATSLITTRVTDNEGDISSISADVTTLQADLNLAEGGIVANGLAVTALDTRVTSAEGIITSHSSDITTLESDVVSLQTDTTGNATAITNLDTRVTATETTTTSNATSITSLESDVGDLQTDTSGNATAITGLDTRVTNAEGSITTNATAITGLTTTVNGHTTSISENISSINGVTAQYSVTINNNNEVSGFGLISDIIDGDPTSSFTVNADSFGIGAGVASVVWDNTITYSENDVVTYLGVQYQALRTTNNDIPSENADDWQEITKFPFVVYTTNQNITKNGTSYTIPAGTYIADAFIQNASIDTAQIQNAAIETAQIDNLAVTNAKIDNLAVTNAKISNLAVTEGKIANLAVDTIKIADQAVTIPVSAYTSAITTSSGEHEVQSVTIASTGAPIEILCSVRLKRVAFGSSTGFVKIYRDTTLIYSAEADVSAIPIITTFAISDTPSASTYTYKLVVSSTGSMIKSNRYMRALETKK